MFSMPGKNYVYNDDIEVTVHPIPHDLDKLQSAIENGAKDINRALTVPQGIGWSYDPNHATMENSLLAWYNGVLAFKRSHLDSVMWLQLYKPQLETIWGERQMSQMRLATDMSTVVNQLVQKAEDLNNGKPPLPFRITTEFKNIKTTGFLELSSALLGWEAAGIITPEIARTEGGLGQYNDDMAEHEQKQAMLPNNLLTQEQGMMMTAQGQGQGQQGQGIGGLNPVNTSTGQSALSRLPSGQVHASTTG
jgi:hypothetical protein